MIPVWAYAILAAVIIGGVAWRVTRRWLVRRSLSLALRSPRESRRQVAVRECVEVGIAETAAMLVRHLRQETSPAVLRELAVALAERQWEPASKAAILKLRIWAREYGIEHPGALADVKKITGLVGHAPASKDEKADTPATAPELASGQAEATVAASGAGQEERAADQEDRNAEQAEPESKAKRGAVPEIEPVAARRQVAPTTILVSGVRSPAAVATLGELRKLGHRCLAADWDLQAAGLRLADVAEVMPSPDSAAFVVSLVQAARAHGATAMICTAPDEQGALQTAGEELAAAGIRWAAPNLEALRTCADPTVLRDVLQGSGLRIQPTLLAQVPDRGIREFTADLLMSESSQAVGLATHWRLETTAGLSGKAETFADDRVTDACIRAAKAVRLTGPASVLGYVRADGEPTLTDTRCYFSTDLALSLRAGADFVGQHLRQVFGLPVQVERLRSRAGVIMSREFRETFEE
jgi:carbamoyl-phosphate synthase large subunit